MKKLPNAFVVTKTYDPRYNLKVVGKLKDLNQLHQIKDIVRRNKNVTDLKAYVWSDVRNMPENIALILPANGGGVNEASPSLHSSDGRDDKLIDEIDLQIIEELSKNSRESFKTIADRIGTSLDTVSRRYKKLVKNRIIKPSIQIDPKKIGYNAMVYFGIAFASQNDTAAVVEKITALKDTTLIIKSSGDYDLRIYVLVRDIDQLLAVQNEIANVPGITRMETLISDVPIPWPVSQGCLSTF